MKYCLKPDSLQTFGFKNNLNLLESNTTLLIIQMKIYIWGLQNFIGFLRK
jgi:hypothetical protein